MRFAASATASSLIGMAKELTASNVSFKVAYGDQEAPVAAIERGRRQA